MYGSDIWPARRVDANQLPQSPQTGGLLKPHRRSTSLEWYRSATRQECWGRAEHVRGCLTDRAYAAGDPPAAAKVLDDGPCPAGHNTPLPLERAPPASYKRLLGRAHSYSKCNRAP